LGTISQNISWKAFPMPAIINNGKNRTPKIQVHPSSSDSISNEKPNNPAKMHISETPTMINKSLLIKISSIKIKNNMSKISFSGVLNRQEQLPQVSSQHWQHLSYCIATAGFYAAIS
jgi:hypothetical protein